jgi:hypothetical protein
MDAIDLRKKKMKKLNKLYKEIMGKPIDVKIPDIVVEDEFDTMSELQSVSQQIKNFMRSFGIGYKIKSFSKEPGAIKKTRNILQKFLDADYEPEGGVRDLNKKIKDEVQEYKDGKPNITDWEIERVARTELSSMRELHKLMEWRSMGFSKVKHKATVDARTGSKDKRFNGRVFKIDYLLKKSDDRIPLHPNCFPAGTLITLFNGKCKCIEDIKIGDVVKTHFGNDKEVIGVTQNKYDGKLYHYRGLWATPNHPVFVNDNFVNIIDVSDDNKVFEGIVYNFEVKDDQSYIANGVKVHNCRCRYVLHE